MRITPVMLTTGKSYNVNEHDLHTNCHFFGKKRVKFQLIDAGTHGSGKITKAKMQIIGMGYSNAQANAFEMAFRSFEAFSALP